MADLAIDETNRIRASLGLPLLPTSSSKSNSNSRTGPTFKSQPQDDSSSEEESEGEQASTLETRAQAGYDNWTSKKAEDAAKTAHAKKVAAIQAAKLKAQRFARLEGKGLADDDDVKEKAEGKVESAREWLMGQKKRQKRIEKERLKAEKLEKELEERERNAVYSERDLQGLTIAHGEEDFEGADGQVLTLADKNIDEEDDELESGALKEIERAQQRQSTKIKKPVYDPTDDSKREILSHYDENEGKARKRFKLDAETVDPDARERKRQEVGEKIKKGMVSLDAIKSEVLQSDYAAPVEAKIKKPKKKKDKKEKKKRTKDDDEDDIFPIEAVNGESMDVDGVNGRPVQSKRPVEAETFVDDDDLQTALAAQRRLALKKRKRMKPEDIAKDLREAEENEMKVEEEPAGLVLDESTEFLGQLARNREEAIAKATEEAAAKSSKRLAPHKQQKSPSSDDAMEVDPNDLPSDEEQIKREGSASGTTPADTNVGLDEEQTVSSGLGATLGLLQQRGLVERNEDTDLAARQRAQSAFLAEKRKRQVELEERARTDRERMRKSGAWDRMSAKERENYSRQANEARELQESRAITEAFREYRPSFELRHVDEFGRELDQKEAFKALSHGFHGKGSGKGKQDKRLKKIEEEKARASKSMLDTSRSGMDSAAGTQARKQKEAGVRLA